jgi:hypothetical protein
LIILLSLAFIDFVAVYYAGSLIVDLISLVSGYIVGTILEGYLSPNNYVTLTGFAFLGSIAIAALLVSSGYVLTFGIFLIPLLAGLSFVYTALSDLFRLRVR